MTIKGFTQTILRWPILFLVSTILAIEVLAYFTVRLLVQLYELLTTAITVSAIISNKATTNNTNYSIKLLKSKMLSAIDFTEWSLLARELDELESRNKWKSNPQSPYYDYLLIQEHTNNLITARSVNNYNQLIKLLSTIYSTYNIGGINNSQLYSETHFNTKQLIQEFIQQVLECTIIIRDCELLSIKRRREFFIRIKRNYGRSALLLSGGAANGYFHIGVLKALWESKNLPKILSGASAGSLICGYLAVRTDAELFELFNPITSSRLFRACSDSWSTTIYRYLTKGYAFDVNQWIGCLQSNITKGDTTFIEAYRMTGRIINITITSVSKYVPSVILNYRTAPDVVIWSAILASSAFPNVIQPVELLSKDSVTNNLHPFLVHGRKFVDGTVKVDIPLKEISKMHNANFFIVSQVNPHLLPFVYNKHGSTGKPSPHRSGSGMRGGFILSMIEKFLKLEMKKWISLLSDLDIMPAFFGADWRFIFTQQFHGTVTIYPSAPLWSYFKLISDPTEITMKSYINYGERATWPKLARIANHFRFERLLADCKGLLDRQYQQQLEQGNSIRNNIRLKPTSNQIPSITASAAAAVTEPTDAVTEAKEYCDRTVTDQFQSLADTGQLTDTESTIIQSESKTESIGDTDTGASNSESESEFESASIADSEPIGESSTANLPVRTLNNSTTNRSRSHSYSDQYTSQLSHLIHYSDDGKAELILDGDSINGDYSTDNDSYLKQEDSDNELDYNSSIEDEPLIFTGTTPSPAARSINRIRSINNNNTNNNNNNSNNRKSNNNNN